MVPSGIVPSSRVWAQIWLQTCQHGCDLEEAARSVTQFGVHWLGNELIPQGKMIPEAEPRKNSSFGLLPEDTTCHTDFGRVRTRTQMLIPYSPFSLDQRHPVTLPFSKKWGHEHLSQLLWFNSAVRLVGGSQGLLNLAAHFGHPENLTKFQCPAPPHKSEFLGMGPIR